MRRLGAGHRAAERLSPASPPRSTGRTASCHTLASRRSLWRGVRSGEPLPARSSRTSPGGAPTRRMRRLVAADAQLDHLDVVRDLVAAATPVIEPTAVGGVDLD